MDDREMLRSLEVRQDNLRKSIGNVEHDILDVEEALIRGEPPGRLVAYLRERNEALHGHLLDLGHTERQIIDIKARMQERDDSANERKQAEAWDRQKNASSDADRDWFRRSGEAKPVREESLQPLGRDWFRKEQDDEKDRIAAEDRYDRERRR